MQFHFKGIYPKNTVHILKTLGGGRLFNEEGVKWNKKKQGENGGSRVSQDPKPICKAPPALQKISS